jgi:hypothetical protein
MDKDTGYTDKEIILICCEVCKNEGNWSLQLDARYWKLTLKCNSSILYENYQYGGNVSFKSTHGYRKGTLADILYYGRGPVELVYNNRYKPIISSIQMESCK